MGAIRSWLHHLSLVAAAAWGCAFGLGAALTVIVVYLHTGNAGLAAGAGVAGTVAAATFVVLVTTRRG